MPRRGEKGQQSKQTEQYRKMYKNAPQLCKSQVYNALYDKLKRDGRLDRFIAVVQYCSIHGYNKEQTVKKLVSSFPGYITDKELTVKCFDEMLKAYNDISVAWGWGDLGDDITQVQLKNKALSLIENNGTLEDIKMYNEIFVKTDEASGNENNGTVFNFNMTKDS
jgi:hypothetical protein